MDTTTKTMRSVLLAHFAAITVAAASGCSAGDAVPAGDESPRLGTAASADGPNDRSVTAQNQAAFDMSFQVICVNPGTTAWIFSPVSSNFSIDTSRTIDLNMPGLVQGASCWVRAIIVGDSTHDSGDNFTYDPNGGTAVYQITGGTLNPSWSIIGG